MWWTWRDSLPPHAAHVGYFLTNASRTSSHCGDRRCDFFTSCILAVNFLSNFITLLYMVCKETN